MDEFTELEKESIKFALAQDIDFELKIQTVDQIRDKYADIDSMNMLEEKDSR